MLKNTSIPVSLKNDQGETCAHRAAKYGHLTCLRLILNANPSRLLTAVCEKTNRGLTILHLSVILGHTHVVTWLCDEYKKILVMIKDENGQTALHFAAAKGFCFKLHLNRKIIN